MPISDEDFQNEICGIVTKYGVRDIYDATTEILLAVEKKQQPRQEWIPADVLSGLKGAMWVFEQHNLLHFGATHNTVILARQQLEIINKLINELPSPPKDK